LLFGLYYGFISVGGGERMLENERGWACFKNQDFIFNFFYNFTVLCQNFQREFSLGSRDARIYQKTE
jgi:hypothetical protein